MKASVTIQFIVDDLESVENIVKAGLGTSATVEAVVERPAGTVSMTSVPAPTPTEAAKPELTPAQKGAATKARKAAEKAAKKDAPPASKATAPKASQGMLNKAMSAAIESSSLSFQGGELSDKEARLEGIKAIRALIGTFTGKDGTKCIKMSDIKEKDFAAVIAVLKEATETGA